MKRTLVLIGLTFALSSCMTFNPNRVTLGEQYIPYKGESAIINVGDSDAFYRAVYFQVDRSDVEVSNMVIIYGNGERERIKTRLVFKEGSRSRYIKLEGGKRHIKSIEFTYKTIGNWLEGRALFRVYGVK